ncbi:MAG: B12-binding domain-containing radical SAM protein [Bacteriovoracaceae bacterium]
MPRIAFINPLTLPIDLIESTLNKEVPSMQNLSQEGISLPMGIMYLSSYIKKHRPNFKVDLVDYRVDFLKINEYKTLDQFITEVAEKHLTEAPDILAFSVLVSSSHHFFKRSLTLLKQMYPKATVILGGFHATNFTKELMQLPEIDFIFRGEGEYALNEFLQNFEDGVTKEIDGVISRSTDLSQPFLKCTPIASMDENPMPDYELIPMDVYSRVNTRMVIKKQEGKEVLSADIMTSLGCPFKCTFCSSRTVHGLAMRYKSIENVVAEVKYLHEKYGVTLFMPEDDLFTVHRTRTINLLRELRNLKIPGFRMQYPVALAVNTLSYEVIDELIASGMDVASLAIESGSDYTQKHIINKGVKLDKAIDWVNYLREKNIPVRTSFILGLPNETRAMMQESIDYAIKLGADWYDFFIATPLAGTVMCQQFVDMGYVPNDIDIISRGYYAQRNFDTPEISAKDLSDLVYRANLICNFVNNVNFRLKNWEKAYNLFAPIAGKYKFHLIAHDCLWRCSQSMGNQEQAEKHLNDVIEAVKSDTRAVEMFEKYGDLLSPEIRNAVYERVPAMSATKIIAAAAV